MSYDQLREEDRLQQERINASATGSSAAAASSTARFTDLANTWERNAQTLAERCEAEHDAEGSGYARAMKHCASRLRRIMESAP